MEHDFDPATINTIAEAQVAFEAEEAQRRVRQEKINKAIELRNQMYADRKGMLLAAGTSEDEVKGMGFETYLDGMETWTDQQIDQFLYTTSFNSSQRSRLIRRSNHDPKNVGEHIVVETYVQDFNVDPKKQEETYGLKINKNMDYASPTHFNMTCIGVREKGQQGFSFDNIRFEIRAPLYDTDGNTKESRSYWVDLQTDGTVKNISVWDIDPITKAATQREGAYPGANFYDEAEHMEHIGRAKRLLTQLQEETGTLIAFAPNEGEELDLGATIAQNIQRELDSATAMPVIRYRNKADEQNP